MGLLTDLRNMFLPNYCLVCHNILYADEQYVCMPCIIGLPYTRMYKEPRYNDLAYWLYTKAPIDKAIGFIYYLSEDNTTDLLYFLKYRSGYQLGVEMGRMMAREAMDSGFFDDIDIIIPVPISKERMKKRKYNQSEALARGMSEVTGVPVSVQHLIKPINNQTQTRLHGRERLNNASGAYALTPDSTELSGKHCLLVDDMITTGATIVACARELLKVPGVRVSIYSWSCLQKRHDERILYGI